MVQGVKRGNLYAEQDQIGPDLRVARPYCKCISIGTGKVATPFDRLRATLSEVEGLIAGEIRRLDR